jgi:hypothetical protein
MERAADDRGTPVFLGVDTHLDAHVGVALQQLALSRCELLLQECQKRSFLLHSSIPLQSACAFSHLYPTPLHIVVGLVITTSAEAHFTLLVPGFYSRSWI